MTIGRFEKNSKHIKHQPSPINKDKNIDNEVWESQLSFPMIFYILSTVVKNVCLTLLILLILQAANYIHV